MRIPALHESPPSLDEWRGPKYEAFSDHIALAVKGGKQRHGLRRPSFRGTATPISASFLAFFLGRWLVTCTYIKRNVTVWLGWGGSKALGSGKLSFDESTALFCPSRLWPGRRKHRRQDSKISVYGTLCRSNTAIWPPPLFLHCRWLVNPRQFCWDSHFYLEFTN